MVFLADAIDNNVIMNADYSWALFHEEVDLHLKHILGHFGSKWHSLELVPCLVSIDNQQLAVCFGEVYL